MKRAQIDMTVAEPRRERPTNTLNRHASLANINYQIKTPPPIDTENNTPINGPQDAPTVYSTPTSVLYQLKSNHTPNQAVYATRVENLKYSSVRSQQDVSIYRQKSMPTLQHNREDLPSRKASLHSLRDERMAKYTRQAPLQFERPQ